MYLFIMRLHMNACVLPPISYNGPDLLQQRLNWTNASEHQRNKRYGFHAIGEGGSICVRSFKETCFITIILT